MQCIKILSNNKQCQANAQHNKDFCFRHDPENDEVKLLASSKGGSNRILRGIYGEPVLIETPKDAKNFIAQVISAVWSNGVPVQVGTSLGFLTRCWMDAYEASEITQRIEIAEKLVIVKNSDNQ